MPVVAGRLVVSSDDGSQVESIALQAQSVIWGQNWGIMRRKHQQKKRN